ncbi:hypothetical protein [Phaeovulum sp.]|jgi:hypothetical protein|uniref:hypothetical protein n=1 Tax=Phaeovulum sp. TaxID=2934796 RepID=UPI002730F176|nr:hypothetical protein [Phaeovulum sp.]MDP1668934.1 hypothetical protein [Phaeovulum sp.]MDP2063902.1 hypothetical protein [Phaeovulum sp.]MDP3860409.1 hypothetical protein [Phaeovulum sp.]MDZ4119205.1 hypothetical protein [Phaeovulum sp.]
MVSRSALFAAALAASAAGAQDIGGRYEVQGRNFDGSAYGGTARIVLTSDVTCEIYWVTGSTSSEGICMRSGDVFSAAYQMGSVVGLVIYRVTKGGVLEGTWTVAGSNGVGYETLLPR